MRQDEHLLTVHRYVERNAVRAGLVRRAEDWRWSSAAPAWEGGPVLTPGPVRHLVDWLRNVNEPQTEIEVEALRECIRRRRPYGNQLWTHRTARKMGLEASLRPRARPPKKAGKPTGLFGAEETRG